MPLTAESVSLLRAAQASIADASNPFNMASWGECIAGHLYACHHHLHPGYSLFHQSYQFASGGLSRLLGVSQPAISILCSCRSGESDSNRPLAIRRIEDFIQEHTPTHPDASLRGESRSRSPRAKAEERVEVAATAKTAATRAPAQDRAGELVGVY